MPSVPFLSYSPKTTSINFPWPPQLTGIERIALSAQGGLQRILSAFFARPISIILVYSSTIIYPTCKSQPPLPLVLPNPAAISSASPSTPIIQTRQVLLQCAGKTVCTATSTVRITSPLCARLFLEDQYAIGQMFTRLEKVPDFELVSVGLGEVRDAPSDTNTNDDGLRTTRRGSSCATNNEMQKPVQLWRKYRLSVSDFECDILEVFPDRDMFFHGERWLDTNALVDIEVGGEKGEDASSGNPGTGSVAVATVKFFRQPQNTGINVNLYILVGFLCLLAFELSLFFDRPYPC